MELNLLVIAVPETSPVPVGRSYVVDGDVTIGRSSTHPVHLPDATVSRRHVRLERTARGWRVHNCSSANGVFVDECAVAPGGATELSRLPCRLQVGGVLLELRRLEQTRPVTEPLEADASALAERPGPALLELVRDGDGCSVHCLGRLVAMRPSAALVLYALAQSPGQVVHTWDILDLVSRDALHLAQAVSEIRRALRRLFAEGVVELETVRAAMRRVATGDLVDGLDGLDAGALTRRLVYARRGHGYVLVLPDDAVDCREQG